MTCAACAARIEKVLNRLPGVARRSISPPKGRACSYPQKARRRRYCGGGAQGGLRRLSGRGTFQARRHAAPGESDRTRAPALDFRRAHHAVPRADGADARSCTAATSFCRMAPARARDARQFWIGQALLYRRVQRPEKRRRTWTCWWRSARAWRISTARPSSCSRCRSHVYFEASTAIITLVLLGKVLERRAPFAHFRGHRREC